MATFGSQESPRRPGTALYFSALVLWLGTGWQWQGEDQISRLPGSRKRPHYRGAEKRHREAVPSAESYQPFGYGQTPQGKPKPDGQDFSGNPQKKLREHCAYHTQTSSFPLGQKFPVSETIVSLMGTSQLEARTSRGRPKFHTTGNCHIPL